MNILIIPHIKKKHLSPETKFLILGLNIDITNKLIASQDLVYKPKHELKTIPLSNGRRNSKTGNYFDNGINDVAIKHFSRFLNGLFT